MHVLLISPVSMMPTIISTNSLTYPELVQRGYTEIRRGYKKDLEEDEREIMEGMVEALEMNQDN